MLKIAWSKIYNHPLPPKHRFPMIKYDLLPEQLLHEGTITQDNLFEPEPIDDHTILLTHDAAYWEKLKNLKLNKQEERRTGFPLSEALIEREMVIMEGTVQAAAYALENGIAMNIAGGTHHAHTNKGEGFCLLNDNAIGANYLLDMEMAEQILIVDLDVHQGDGTAQIFEGNEQVFTFSMHGAGNFPMQKERSDLDIDLPDGTGDKEYLKILKKNLYKLIDDLMPDFIFFQSGVDVLATDKLGRLALTIEGCKERDRLVIQACKDNNIPLVISMGGGYSDHIKDIIEAHANTYRLAQQIYF